MCKIMIYVCDAIMGTGKSSAAITYMNEHPDKRFIYITPYLDEATRIAEACKSMHFFEPQKKSEYSGSKTLHTMELVNEGRNIATTHQAFRYYPHDLLDLIREQHYTIIIDENVDVLETSEIDPYDVQMAIDAKYVEEYEPNLFRLTKDTYAGQAFKDLFRIMQSRDLIRVKDAKDDSFYFWRFPPELITSFDDVFILTYLFEGQGLHHFLEIHHLPYQYIGIERLGDRDYRFSDTVNYVPPYVKSLPKKIHIVENEKLNQIGDDYFALSLNWFKRDPENVVRLKNNLYNFFFNIAPKKAAAYKLWSTYTGAERKLRGKGYSKGFLPFNTKATNKYKEKTVLSYCVNIFMNVGQKLYYQSRGIEVDEDAYALSIMVQWVWRSAIRDGEEVYIYIPSRRMRELLQNWIKSVSTGGDTP